MSLKKDDHILGWQEITFLDEKRQKYEKGQDDDNDWFLWINSTIKSVQTFDWYLWYSCSFDERLQFQIKYIYINYVYEYKKNGPKVMKSQQFGGWGVLKCSVKY